jgi:hypothetical protein
MIGTNDNDDQLVPSGQSKKIYGFWLLTRITQTRYTNRKKMQPKVIDYHPPIPVLIESELMHIVWHEGTEQQTIAPLQVKGQKLQTRHILSGDWMRAQFSVKDKTMLWRFTFNNASSYTVVEYQFTADND